MESNQEFFKQFKQLNYPPESWIVPHVPAYDVVIIGAGMAGLAAGFALKRLGVHNLKIFDQSKKAFEGPWLTYARMQTLRSTKELVGPALDLPALTFRSWYVGQFGEEAWEVLGKIPTDMWMEYLRWYREVLNIPVENESKLTKITPHDKGIILTSNGKSVLTQKLVLATGRDGFGGARIPDFIKDFPKDKWAHTNDQIDFNALRGKKIGIVGGGASGFDAAAVALDHGATSVDILLRRSSLPNVNKPASITYPGFTHGYFFLPDEEKWKLMKELYEIGIPPPKDALDRVKDRKNFKVHLNAKIELESYDFVILATGFAIDGHKQPELASFIDHVKLWQDINLVGGKDWFYQSPYLGSHFQFLEKSPGSAPFLKHIYCFNYAATVSHGQLSGDIPGIGIGANRLASGIVKDLFAENVNLYYERLKAYDTKEFDPAQFKFF